MRIFHRLSIILPPLMFCIAAFLVHRELKSYPLSQIKDVIISMPWQCLVLGIVLTGLNYLVLSFYDWLGLRYAGQKISIPKLIMASSISYAISNNTGHALISGTSVRYRFYTAWGVPGWDVVKTSFFLALTFIVGAFTLQVITAWIIPGNYAHLAEPQVVRAITWLCAAFLILYWAAVLFLHKPITIRNMTFTLPSPLMALTQTIVSCLDLVLAGFILYLFVEYKIDIPFGNFLTIFIVSLIVGLLSHVPGGLGVFEGMFLWLSGPEISSIDLLGALIIYRILYYFIPLVFAGTGLFIHEAHLNWEFLSKTGKKVSAILKVLVPHLSYILLFLSGTMLLVSVAAPEIPDNITWLEKLVPLSLLEISHLMTGLIGLSLLFLSRGVYLRLDAAYYGCITVLMMGVVFLLFKGLAWKEAAALCALLLLFMPTHKYFDRKSSLLNMPLSARWVLMIMSILVITAMVGFHSYRNISYAHELWWQFTFHGDAPRFLRVLAITTLAAISYIFYRLMDIARPPRAAKPGDEELDRARRVAAASDDTTGFLALLGDKNIMWNEDKSTFIMYISSPRYWVAMGDPVGNSAGYADLLWHFREEADRHGAKAVFYEVSDQNLPLYLDLGLILLKLGAEARVSLPDFDLKGGKQESKRKARNKFINLGYTISIFEPGKAGEHMTALRDISDRWLKEKDIGEKKFSLGFFDESYLTRTRLAIVMKDGKPLAFSNLWDLDSKEEISVDLIRYTPEAPGGIMDYLFLELMLWAKDQGYKWFDMGMAPLSGLERHHLAPLWHKIGTLIYRHGEEFYNFEGLYAYKQKFDPVWRPRYLAAPPGLRIPMVLLTIVAIISGIKKSFKGTES